MRANLKPLCVALLVLASQAAWADTEIIGNVPRITTEFVEVGDKMYPLLHGASNNMRASSWEATECWAGPRTTCGTLAGIGYIDKARITLRNGVAVRIEVLELRQ